MSFLDTMLQLSLLGSTERTLRLPTRIAAVHIDPAVHRQKPYALQGKTQGSLAPPALCPPALRPAPALRRARPSLTHLCPQWSTRWWTGVCRPWWPGASSSRGCTPRQPRGASRSGRPPWRSSASRRTWRASAWPRAQPCSRSCRCAEVRPAPGAPCEPPEPHTPSRAGAGCCHALPWRPPPRGGPVLGGGRSAPPGCVPTGSARRA